MDTRLLLIQFGIRSYKRIVGIPMGDNCAPLVADLFLFCYEKDFVLSFSHGNVSEAFLLIVTEPTILLHCGFGIFCGLL